MPKYYGWGLPFDASVNGHAVDNLIYIIHIFMGLLFLGWLIFFITALVKFRARPGHKAVHHPPHSKISSYLEVAVAIFEVVLLVGFSFPIFNAYRDVRPPKDQAMEVRIVAEQFAWNVHYPGADRQFGKTLPKLMGPGNPIGLDPNDPEAKDDVVAINQLHVPVGKPVIVYLSTKDVIHSFFLPVMRVKQDAVPGQEISVWFEAAKTGKFEIACAQLCGLGHYRMRGFFFIETPEQFQTWVQGLVKK
jgi:cytochrome c oxidase subunit II